jgi:hypothetical protein
MPKGSGNRHCEFRTKAERVRITHGSALSRRIRYSAPGLHVVASGLRRSPSAGTEANSATRFRPMTANAHSLPDSVIGSTVEERFRYTHHGRVRDVLIWENCTMRHLASLDDKWPRQRRLMHRVIVGRSATF